ncbi:phosphoenolpyruvate--protein phosphotransferase [Vallitalea maricola]|uniref:Phosphoenolpyruvate--protein phosphotransferase n=1 Tax=Vallitalea maricola TaxID=3074433 RepID=A0ACB5UHT9_9FIRM|nr:phosphoenolpyruvate--protein phosphotransferase [Vallitalea sp. AN17-2]
MKKYIGKSIYNSIAIGKIKVLEKKDKVIKPNQIEDIGAEKQRFESAKTKAHKQLQDLYIKASKELGEDSAAIFDVHKMLLDDQDYLDFIYNMIEQKVNAEYAVITTGDHFASIFSEMDNDYMKERAADIKDISERLVRILSNTINNDYILEEPVIIVADDLTPSETVQLDKEKVLAFVTLRGSTNSHTAILARMMSIPALVSVKMELTEHIDNQIAIVDGNTGEFLINPDPDTICNFKKMKEEEQEKKRLLQALKGKENVTLDGTRINIFANIGNLSDVDAVLKNDAGGIGLFRSEFLYLERDTYPTEEEQFQVYKQVAEAMEGKKVIIRTLDIGADKQASYFNIDKEENPAMGYRAIRICLDRPELFKTQLTALFRASAFGNIAVMYPMIISVEEIEKIMKIVDEVKAELIERNIKIGNVEQGIMIETPAAVMISDLLAKKVDFLSIGTNDLTQYTLAIDRQNQKLENYYNPHHEAILRMIKQVVDNGHKAGKWVGICGELGADLVLTEEFIRMGLDEISVAPPYVLTIRDKVRKMDLTK